MEGSQGPRRAAEPAPDDWDEPEGVSPESPDEPEFDEPSPMTDTAIMRRLAMNPDGSLAPLIPPPRPVLPSSQTAPAAAGRRFSADDAPFEAEWTAPRRSAVSASSPAPLYEPLLPPVTRPVAPPAVTVSYPSAQEPPRTAPPLTPPYTAASSPAATPASSTSAPAAPAPFTPTPPAASTPTPVFASAASQTSPPPVAPAAEATPSKAELKAEKEKAKADAAQAKKDAAAAEAQAKKDAAAAAAAAKADAKAALAAEKAAAQQATARAKLDQKAAKAEAKAAAKPAKTDARSASNRGSTIDAASRLGLPQNPTPSPATSRALAKEPAARSRRPALLVIVAVISFALIAAAVVTAMTLNRPGGGGPTAATALDPLLTADDVLPVGAGPWQESSLTATPLCIGGGTPKPERATSRRLVTAGNDAVLQVANTYPDDASATSAYAALASMVGTCADGTALIGNASTVTGLADQAQAVQLTVQATKPELHQLLVARTGRTVNVFDLLTSNGVPVTTAAQVAGKSLSRQCGTGTCPTSISVASSLPAAGDPAGWLVSADLPRITAGSGKWTPHDGAVTTPGSHCEGTDLTKVSGTTSSAQRTLILTGDPSAPGTFGVDQVVYSYATSKAAGTLSTNLIKAIDGCTAQAPTASVKQGADVKGTGEAGAVVSGRTWEITHKSNTFTYIYRVAVVTVGNQVTYLVATPSKTFDFTDAQWGAIALRAGQRASQAG